MRKIVAILAAHNAYDRVRSVELIQNRSQVGNRKCIGIEKQQAVHRMQRWLDDLFQLIHQVVEEQRVLGIGSRTLIRRC